GSRPSGGGEANGATNTTRATATASPVRTKVVTARPVGTVSVPLSSTSAAPRTRSGRTAKTVPSAVAVIRPSPTPMRAWIPVIAPSTVPIGAPPTPPRAYSRTKANEPARTDTNAETMAAAMADSLVLGRIFSTPRNTGQATKAVTRAMLVTLTPRALIPPSAKNRAWTMTTTETTTAPIQGPSRMAARAPP